MLPQQTPNFGLLKQPDEAILKALIALEDDENFRVIQQWFLDSSAHVDIILRTAESESLLHRAQGASSILLPFCEYAATPREKAGALKAAKSGVRYAAG